MKRQLTAMSFVILSIASGLSQPAKALGPNAIGYLIGDALIDGMVVFSQAMKERSYSRSSSDNFDKREAERTDKIKKQLKDTQYLTDGSGLAMVTAYEITVSAFNGHVDERTSRATIDIINALKPYAENGIKQEHIELAVKNASKYELSDQDLRRAVSDIVKYM